MNHRTLNKKYHKSRMVKKNRYIDQYSYTDHNYKKIRTVKSYPTNSHKLIKTRHTITHLSSIIKYGDCIKENFIILCSIYHINGKCSNVVENIIHNIICLYKKVLKKLKCSHDKLLEEYILIIKIHIDNIICFIKLPDDCIFYKLFGGVQDEFCYFLETIVAYSKTLLNNE